MIFILADICEHSCTLGDGLVVFGIAVCLAVFLLLF